MRKAYPINSNPKGGCHLRSRSILFLAAGVVLAVVVVTTVSVRAGKTKNTAKAVQGGNAKQDPPGTIDGAVNPALIPDHVAYELLFRSIAPRPGAADIEQRGSHGLAKKTGLEDTKVDALRTVADEFKQRISVLDLQAKQLKDRYWPNPSPLVMAQLTGLQKQREAIIAELVASLPRHLGSDGAAKLTQHLNDQVKRRVRIVPSPPLASGQHH